MNKHVRYNRSEKGRVRNERYEKTAKALRRKIKYDSNRYDRPYEPFLQQSKLAERERYEASGSDLPMYQWLNIHEPLGKLVMPA